MIKHNFNKTVLTHNIMKTVQQHPTTTVTTFHLQTVYFSTTTIFPLDADFMKALEDSLVRLLFAGQECVNFTRTFLWSHIMLSIRSGHV